MSYYCSKIEWALKMGNFTQYASNGTTGYLDKHKEPTDGDLEDMLEEMTQIMNSEDYLNTETNLSDTRYVKRLRRICFNGTQFMRDEIIPRRQNRSERIGYVPKDYMRPTDRSWLTRVGVAKGNLVVGLVG